MHRNTFSKLLELKQELAQEKKENKFKQNNTQNQKKKVAKQAKENSISYLDNGYQVYLAKYDKTFKITNQTKAKITAREHPVCKCNFISDLRNATFSICDGTVCTCVHDNKHRLLHLQLVGSVRINPKGFAFIEQSGKDIFVSPNETALVLDQFNVSYVCGTQIKGKVAHIKNVINHPYIKVPAQVISLAPLKIKLLDTANLVKTFVVTQVNEKVNTNQLTTNSIVLATLINPTAKLENKNSNFEFAIDSYVCEQGDPQYLWLSELKKFDLSTDDIEVPLEQDKDNNLRCDLTEIPFISIDNEETEDVDDVILVHKISPEDLVVGFSDDKKTYTKSPVKLQSYDFKTCPSLNNAKLNVPENTKYILAVGIADPTTYFSPGSPADLRAKEVLQTYYLPAFVLNMLPKNIVRESSLLEQQNRPAVVGFLYFDEQTNFTGLEYRIATINNKAKLSYDQTSDLLFEHKEVDLTGHGIPASKIIALLKDLQEFYDKRIQWRVDNCRSVLYSANNNTYIIDEQGKCIDIIPGVLRETHNFISECMLSYNYYTAMYLNNYNIPCIYYNQFGIKDGNILNFDKYINGLYEQKHIPELKPYTNLSEIDMENYHKIKEILFKYNKIYTSRILRFMDSSEYDKVNNEHYGLGLEAYTNATSPIRRYVDIINQRNLKSFILDQATEEVDQQTINEINDTKNSTRIIRNKITSVLDSQYLAQHKDQEFEVEITTVLATSIRVKDVKSGIPGYIYYRSSTLVDKIHADINVDVNLLEFSLNGKCYTLGDKLKVTLRRIEEGKIVYSWDKLNNLYDI